MIFLTYWLCVFAGFCAATVHAECDACMVAVLVACVAGVIGEFACVRGGGAATAAPGGKRVAVRGGGGGPDAAAPTGVRAAPRTGFVYVSARNKSGKGWSGQGGGAAEKLIALAKQQLDKPLTPRQFDAVRRHVVSGIRRSPLLECDIIYVGGDDVARTAACVQRVADTATVVQVADDLAAGQAQ